MCLSSYSRLLVLCLRLLSHIASLSMSSSFRPFFVFVGNFSSSLPLRGFTIFLGCFSLFWYVYVALSLGSYVSI